MARYDDEPRPSRANPRTFVIEVVDMDARIWTACATELPGIIKELRCAPTAVTITIYEWMLTKAINPQGDFHTRYPTWRLMQKSPWVLGMGAEPDGD